VDLNKITYEVKDQIAYVGFGQNEKKSMTTLSRATLEELSKVLDELEANQKAYKGLIFFSHKPNVFLAGVEIEMIQALKSESDAQSGSSEGQRIFNRVEDLNFPTMSLVDGICLGGGSELAVSCNSIIGSTSKKKLK
jgi:3-hydroxyacyl-CoA dehydrogenase/enoyl-CoA hydratase/3-hydroxybutyryl-CoA epimerase